MTHFQIIDNKTAKLVTDDYRVRNLVAKGLTFQHPGARFTKAFKTGGWDGSISHFRRVNNTFPAGLIDLAKESAKSLGLDIDVIDARPPQKIKMPHLTDIVSGKTLRGYQKDAVKTIFGKTRGIIQAPTGSGKTVIAAAAIRVANQNGKKVLFLTHQKELFYQTQKAFVLAGIDTGLIGDSVRDLDHPTIIGMVPTLYAGLEKRDKKTHEIIRRANPQIVALLQSVDFLIIDEAHHGAAESFEQVCIACTGAYWRIGLTATPLMKGLLEDVALIAQTGGIITRITIEHLIDEGMLAQPYIQFVRVNTPLLPQTLPYRVAYKLGVAENQTRHAQVVAAAVRFAENKLTTLILVNSIQHGRALLERLHFIEGLRVQFIHGTKSTETRADAIKALAEQKLDVLISSVITDEGVDIPAVSAVILAGGMKSVIKLYQRIGRGMRPKEKDNKVLIVDFIDLTNKHLARHSMEHYLTIKNEPGFIIVNDFDNFLK